MERRKPEGRGQGKDIVTLADLAPRHDVTGGSRRRVFGADAPLHGRQTSQENTMAGTKKTKDLSPKKSPVGGKKTA